MSDSKVMIKAAMKTVEARFSEYEDMNAGFVHIRDGVCLRAYRQYEGEVDTNKGEDPETSISGWSDVADYIDEHMV